MSSITFAHKKAVVVKKPHDNEKNSKTGCSAQWRFIPGVWSRSWESKQNKKIWENRIDVGIRGRKSESAVGVEILKHRIWSRKILNVEVGVRYRILKNSEVGSWSKKKTEAPELESVVGVEDSKSWVRVDNKLIMSSKSEVGVKKNLTSRSESWVGVE